MVAQREQMNIVIVGHVDHGKSTLVGRLLADTDSLPDGKLEAVKNLCLRQGKVFEYAFLLDALEAERDQGITIDSARCFFKTPRRDIIVIDAPGHIEFLKNMISGAARAESALLLIDAHEGVRENSRRHGYVLGLLGIRQVTVLVNKMDLVGFDRGVFERIEEEYRAFLLECGLVPQRFIPISARDGDNVARHATTTPWYRGPTVLEAVDLFTKAAPRHVSPLRFPVQDVYKWNRAGDERRIVAGRIESGRLAVGDQLLFSPSMKSSTVASIEVFSPGPSGLPREVAAPDCTGVTLSEQIFVARGEIVSLLSDPPHVSSRFRANVVWLGRQPAALGKALKLKLTTVEIACKIAEIKKVLDASTLASEVGRTEVRRHEVAEVVIEARRPIAFDTVDKFEATGRFVLVDGYDVAGGGIILEALSDALERHREEARVRAFEWEEGLVSNQDRQARYGHRAALVLLTGAANVGKAAIARGLEKALFDADHHAYRLDGKNVYLGVDSAAVGDRHEVVRRYAEVAFLFLDAGHLVVSTSNTFGLGDHAVIRTLVTPHPVVHVHVGAPDEAPDADLVLPPSVRDAPAEVVAAAVGAIRGLLAERGLAPDGPA
ncbi:MAG: adenylyl-sulfate kinase [Deltaproteobacteria bacterium]|nr:adenylyl-sulfate kinase [Deltaproteobacteria bacterium]